MSLNLPDQVNSAPQAGLTAGSEGRTMQPLMSRRGVSTPMSENTTPTMQTPKTSGGPRPLLASKTSNTPTPAENSESKASPANSGTSAAKPDSRPPINSVSAILANAKKIKQFPKPKKPAPIITTPTQERPDRGGDRAPEDDPNHGAGGKPGGAPTTPTGGRGLGGPGAMPGGPGGMPGGMPGGPGGMPGAVARHPFSSGRGNFGNTLPPFPMPGRQQNGANGRGIGSYNSVRGNNWGPPTRFRGNVRPSWQSGGRGRTTSRGPPNGAQDWDCPGCKNKNFHWRDVCNRCQAPKPPKTGMPGITAIAGKPGLSNGGVPIPAHLTGGNNVHVAAQQPIPVAGTAVYRPNGAGVLARSGQWTTSLPQRSTFIPTRAPGAVAVGRGVRPLITPGTLRSIPQNGLPGRMTTPGRPSIPGTLRRLPLRPGTVPMTALQHTAGVPIQGKYFPVHSGRTVVPTTATRQFPPSANITPRLSTQPSSFTAQQQQQQQQTTRVFQQQQSQQQQLHQQQQTRQPQQAVQQQKHMQHPQRAQQIQQHRAQQQQQTLLQQQQLLQQRQPQQQQTQIQTQPQQQQQRAAPVQIGQWTKYQTETGEDYYHNFATNETTWDKPKEFETGEASHNWVVYSTGEGKLYYYNLITKFSTYDRPPELGEPQVEKKAPVVTSQPPPTDKTVKPSLPTSSKISIVTPSVLGKSGVKTGFEFKKKTTPTNWTDDAIKKARESASVDKTVEFKRIADANKKPRQPVESHEDQVNKFKALLKEKKVKDGDEWKDILSRIIFDQRFSAISTLRERKEIFKEFKAEAKKAEKAEKLKKREKIKKEFNEMLKECEKIGPKSKFRDIEDLCKDDDRWKAVRKRDEQKNMAHDYVKELVKKVDEEKRKKFKESAKAFDKLVRACTDITHKTKWKDVKSEFRKEECYKELDEDNRIDIFHKYHREVVDKYEKKKEEEAKARRKKEQEARAARNKQEKEQEVAFLQLLKDLAFERTLFHAKSKWSEVNNLDELKADSRYACFLPDGEHRAGRHFDDFCCDLEDDLKPDKEKLKQILKENSIVIQHDDEIDDLMKNHGGVEGVQEIKSARLRLLFKEMVAKALHKKVLKEEEAERAALREKKKKQDDREREERRRDRDRDERRRVSRSSRHDRDRRRDRGDRDRSQKRDRSERGSRSDRDRSQKRDRSERDRLERGRSDRGDKDRSDKDRSNKDRSEKDRGEKDHGEKDHSEKDRSEKDRSDKDRSEKDRSDKDRSDKDRSDKDRSDKDRSDKDRSEKDRSEKDHSEKDRSAKDGSDKDRGDKDRSEKDRTDRDRSDKDRGRERDRDGEKRRDSKVHKEKSSRSDREDKEKVDRDRSDRSERHRRSEKSSRAERDESPIEKERRKRRKTDKDSKSEKDKDGITSPSSSSSTKRSRKERDSSAHTPEKDRERASSKSKKRSFPEMDSDTPKTKRKKSSSDHESEKEKDSKRSRHKSSRHSENDSSQRKSGSRSPSHERHHKKSSRR